MQFKDAPFTLETAMELYDLQHHEVLWQKEPTDTKCLLAWVRRLPSLESLLYTLGPARPRAGLSAKLRSIGLKRGGSTACRLA